MRTIKFRAWLSDMNKMDYDPKMGSMSAMQIVSLNESLSAWKGNLMQFTGLLDKNGKEIYEGDILLYEIVWKKKLPEKHYWEVYWNQERARYYTRMAGKLPSALYFQAPTHSIIGNIYENPELLK